MSAVGSESLRRRIARALDPAARKSGLSPTNKVLTGLIVAAVVVAIIETEATITAGRQGLFEAMEVFFATVFGLEYLSRLWTAPEVYPHLPAWKARLKWMVSPFALIDLAALVPALVLAGAEPAYMLRLLRLLRILRLAKLGRFSRAMALVAEAVNSRKLELTLAVGMAVMVLIVVSTLMSMIEGANDPEHFGSIPRAMWWAAITLTTIGYGDVVPVTPLGKMLGVVTAVTGIGLIAAPTGILAAAFSDAAVRRRAEAEIEAERCEDPLAEDCEPCQEPRAPSPLA